MTRTLLAIFFLAAACLLGGCPDKTDDLGGAPKQQIDHVKQKLNEASEKAAERLNEAVEEAEK